MSPVQLEDPPQREGLIAEAIRCMAQELQEHERVRAIGALAAIDRTLAALSAGGGRLPTAREVAALSGTTVEDVLEARLAR